MGLVTGWGKESETSSGASVTLRKVRVPIFDKLECQMRFRRVNMVVTDGMLCAGATGKDSCSGELIIFN